MQMTNKHSRKRLEVNKGDKFHDWEVIKEVEPLTKGQRRFLCKSLSGKEKEVNLSHLRTGKSKGIYRSITHGMTKTRIHNIWSNMKRRCNNSKDISYKNYGGRGIKVCPEWQKFINFYADMYPTYKSNLELERIDNNGNYEPSNCRWATRKEQSLNKRSSVLITYQGKTQTISQWSEEVGIPYRVLRTRIRNYDWSLEDAMDKTNIGKIRFHTKKGKRSTIKNN